MKIPQQPRFNPAEMQGRVLEAEGTVKKRALEVLQKSQNGTLNNDAGFKDMMETQQKWMQSDAMQRFNPMNVFRGGMTADQATVQQLTVRAQLGDHEVATQLQGNFAAIGADSGLQTISAQNVVITGGGGGQENFAQFYSGTGGQNITATGIALSGGRAGGGNSVGNAGGIRTNASSQSITVGSGGITLTGGGGTGLETDNSAYLNQGGTTGTSQTITFNGGGSLSITGGSSDKTDVGGTGHGSRAQIDADGVSQTLAFNSPREAFALPLRNPFRNFDHIQGQRAIASCRDANVTMWLGGMKLLRFRQWHVMTATPQNRPFSRVPCRGRGRFRH